MRSPLFIAVAAGLALLLAGAVAVYAYDASRDDHIAAGVKVGGVDVGGMGTAEASAVLRRELVRPLRRPVTAEARGRRFRLTAEQAKLRPDVPGMVAAAVERSREGNLLSRTARDLTGGEVEAELPAKVSYSPAAVAALVRRVKRAVERPPRDARVAPSPAGLNRVRARVGIQVEADDLREAVGDEILLPRGDRTAEARLRYAKPSISTSELRARYPWYIVINRGGFQLTLYRHLRQVRSYRIAVGQAGYDTPAGLYRIQNKAVNPAWHVPNSSWAGELAGRVIPPGPENPIKSRWMGIADGAGIHGTSEIGSLGSAASRGCIRMSIPEVKELYSKVPTGARVYIGG
jgi:lipoprotein-anchoring transpeptidase ErfK/SrfK